MARVDKYDPITGGFRGDVYEDFPDADLNKIWGFGINSAGQLVKGAGNSGIVGIVVQTQKPGRIGPLKEVSRIDVMRQGCITDFCATTDDTGVDVGTAGTAYYAATDGNISSTPAAGSVLIGYTVEPDRLEVNMGVGTALVTAPRIKTIVSNANPTYNTDEADIVSITAQAAAIVSMTTNKSGTAVNGQKLGFRIKDDNGAGAPYAIGWGADFIASGVTALLTTTVKNKTVTEWFIYDSVAAKWVADHVDATAY